MFAFQTFWISIFNAFSLWLSRIDPIVFTSFFFNVPIYNFFFVCLSLSHIDEICVHIPVPMFQWICIFDYFGVSNGGRMCVKTSYFFFQFILFLFCKLCMSVMRWLCKTVKNARQKNDMKQTNQPTKKKWPRIIEWKAEMRIKTPWADLMLSFIYDFSLFLFVFFFHIFFFCDLLSKVLFHSEQFVLWFSASLLSDRKSAAHTHKTIETKCRRQRMKSTKKEITDLMHKLYLNSFVLNVFLFGPVRFVNFIAMVVVCKWK